MSLPKGKRPMPRIENGFSILEVAIYLAVLVVLGIPLSMITVSVGRTTEEGNLLAKILERNRAALHGIAGEYKRALSGTTAITNFGKTLSFTLPGGFDGTGPTAGNIVRYEIQADPSDPANGVDDNGNGVVDESVLVRVNQTTGETVVLAAWLDSNSSGFTARGTGVEVTLSNIGWTPGSQVRTRIARTMVLYPRN